MSKHVFLQIMIVSVMLTGVLPQTAYSEVIKSENKQSITVYKTPTCGCCAKWVSHLEDNGFKVDTIDLKDLSNVKAKSGVTRQLASCHTAVIDGYIIEGHVPAADIKRLLKEKPAVTGLTVPGMVMGSPGMEGHRKDRYNVLTFTKEGESSVFTRY